MKYSQERKQAALAKLAPPHQRTVKDVAAEEGISPATLYHWRQQARLTGSLFPDDGTDPEGWTARDKFTAVMETAALNESERAYRTVALGPPSRRPAGRDRLVQMGLHVLSFVSGHPVGFMWKWGGKIQLCYHRLSWSGLLSTPISSSRRL